MCSGMMVYDRGKLVGQCECQWGWGKLWTKARHTLCVMIGTFCRMELMLRMLPCIWMATRLAEMNMACVRTSGKTVPTVRARSGADAIL